MPSIAQKRRRETIELHAPWWSNDLEPSTDPTPFLQQIAEDDESDNPDIVTDAAGLRWLRSAAPVVDGEAHPGMRYKERAVIYARMLERDQEKIQAVMMPKQMRQFSLDPKRLAQGRRATLECMLLELTDASGQAQTLGLEELQQLDEVDAGFINDAIAFLKKPAFTVLKKDADEAAKYRVDHERKLALGAPVDLDSDRADAESVARRDFRKGTASNASR